MKETLRGTKGYDYESQRQLPSTRDTKNGAMGARTIRRLEPTKRSETSLLLETQTVRRGDDARKHCICTSFFTSPRKPRQTTYQAVQVTGSSLSSPSTQAPSRIPRHANTQAQVQTNSGGQQQKAMEAKVSTMPTPTALPTSTPKAQDQVVYTDQANSRTHDTGRAPQAKHP